MLQFQELMNIFRLLHWNGSLRIMREKGLSLESVLSHYGSRVLDNDMKTQMAMDWVAREQKQNGCIQVELEKAKAELEEFRLIGRELRFYKEKRDILVLACGEAGRL